MTIGIVVNESKDNEFLVLKRLIQSIQNSGAHVIITVRHDHPTAFICPEELKAFFYQEEEALESCDVLICLGGDGTLIKYAKKVTAAKIPLLGINLGTLGYLTEIETNEIDTLIRRITTHAYHIENRMMLSVRKSINGVMLSDVGGEGSDSLVLNELAVNRGATAQVIELAVYLNDTLIDVYSCDGILITTPTGSTAYSLSAGGPVIDPELSVIAIVPISPHMSFSKPIVTSPDKTIKIKLTNQNKSEAFISMDGVYAGTLEHNETLHIGRASSETKMLRFQSDNFYVTLKNKLNNRGDQLRREEIKTTGNDT